MAISFRAAGSWTELTTSQTVGLPAGVAAGDRMFLFATWKEYTITATDPSGWTLIGTEYADGTVVSGNGTGSMKVTAWYRDWQSGDSNPVLSSLSGVDAGGAAIIAFSKGGGDTWDTPLTENASMSSSGSAQTISANGTLAVVNNSVVMALLGIRDDVTVLTRSTSDIDVSSGITWNGDYTEAPTAHHSSIAGDDAAADIGYRFVTTGGTVTLRTSVPGLTETGAIKFVVQGVNGGAGGGGGGASGAPILLTM